MEGFRKHIERFGNIKEEIFRELKANYQQTYLSKKEIFSKEGEYARKVGFLEKGIIRAFVRDYEGKEYTKQFFFAPSIIGAYTSLLTNQPNKIIQQALTDCTIWTAEYSKIEALYDRHHEMERVGRKIAEYYYLEKERSLVEMAQFDADKRYALLKERFPTIESQVQQYHIASYLGVSPTQLSRIRKKIKNS